MELIDLYSRKVIGLAMSDLMTADLIVEVLQMGLWSRKMPNEDIVHSDHDPKYCSAQCPPWLSHQRLQCSVSAKINCYDNACAESFFHSHKVKALHGERFKTQEAMRRQVFEYTTGLQPAAPALCD